MYIKGNSFECSSNSDMDVGDGYLEDLGGADSESFGEVVVGLTTDAGWGDFIDAAPVDRADDRRSTHRSTAFTWSLSVGDVGSGGDGVGAGLVGGEGWEGYVDGGNALSRGGGFLTRNSYRSKSCLNSTNGSTIIKILNVLKRTILTVVNL